MAETVFLFSVSKKVTLFQFLKYQPSLALLREWVSEFIWTFGNRQILKTKCLLIEIIF